MLRAMRGITSLLGPAAVSAALLLTAHSGPLGAEPEPDYAAMRRALVDRIGVQARAAANEIGLPRPSQRILDVIAKVPRHAFVPRELRPYAYLDRPLPVGHGQNISQPYIIALMTEIARVGKDDVVFETGTGAGYHAAILSLLAKRVYSVEVIKPLARRAGEILKRLGYDVRTREGDGYFGWPEAGPYDVIIIKEAVDHVPPALLRQLKPGGRMVLPLGPLNGVQDLTLVEKDRRGRVKRTRMLPVRFSPLQGGERI